jgi:hypothetical protein
MVKHRLAHTVLATHFGYGNAAFLLFDANDLLFCESTLLYACS